MNSPNPVPTLTQAGNALVSFVQPQRLAEPFAGAVSPPLPMAANDGALTQAPEAPPAAAAPRSRVPLAIWLAMMFWLLGTALLLMLGAAYRLLE